MRYRFRASTMSLRPSARIDVRRRSGATTRSSVMPMRFDGREWTPWSVEGRGGQIRCGFGFDGYSGVVPVLWEKALAAADAFILQQWRWFCRLRSEKLEISNNGDSICTTTMQADLASSLVAAMNEDFWRVLMLIFRSIRCDMCCGLGGSTIVFLLLQLLAIISNTSRLLMTSRTASLEGNIFNRL